MLVPVALVGIVDVLARVVLVLVALVNVVHVPRLVAVVLVLIALVNVVDVLACVMLVPVALVSLMGMLLRRHSILLWVAVWSTCGCRPHNHKTAHAVLSINKTTRQRLPPTNQRRRPSGHPEPQETQPFGKYCRISKMEQPNRYASLLSAPLSLTRAAAANSAVATKAIAGPDGRSA